MSNDYSNSAGIMWPADFVGDEKVEDPHATVLFLGNADEIPMKPQYALSEISEHLEAPGEVEVIGTDIFGNDEDGRVLVALLDPTKLAPLQEALAADLKTRTGLESKSSYPDYKPHVTLGPEDLDLEENPVPKSVVLGEPQFWLGNERYILIK